MKVKFAKTEEGVEFETLKCGDCFMCLNLAVYDTAVVYMVSEDEDEDNVCVDLTGSESGVIRRDLDDNTLVYPCEFILVEHTK